LSCKKVHIAHRVMMNVESANMVERLGNVSKKRTVPIVVYEGAGKYSLVWVPAISGNSLAHHYQEEIARIVTGKNFMAPEKGVFSECRGRVDNLCAQGIFLKHFSLEEIKKLTGKSLLKDWEIELCERYAGKRLSLRDMRDVERTIVDNCVVEDVGGFLVSEGPTRRTSCVRFSYALPTEDAIKASQVDNQMMVRHAGYVQSFLDAPVQLPFYEQRASALYGFNVEADLCCIGCYSLGEGCVRGKCDADARRCIALYALLPLLEMNVGAKRSRSMPHVKVEMSLAVISEKPFPMPPATLKLEELLEEVKTKSEKFGADRIVVMAKDEAESAARDALTNATFVETTLDFIDEIAEVADLACG